MRLESTGPFKCILFQYAVVKYGSIGSDTERLPGMFTCYGNRGIKSYY